MELPEFGETKEDNFIPLELTILDSD